LAGVDGRGLFGAFLAYGTILSALYIPIMLMVFDSFFSCGRFEFGKKLSENLFGI